VPLSTSRHCSHETLKVVAIMTAGANGHDDTYDVLILGTGIGGTVLGTILARHGVRVVMVEQGTHPRFAIGESTIPETSLMMRLMSKRYDVPELHHLSSFPEARAHVSNACGVKRNFSFCWQPRGAELDAQQINQILTWAPPFGPDIHYFRQDVDAHMLNAAVRYGARCYQQTKVTDVDISDQGVVARTEKGLTFKPGSPSMPAASNRRWGRNSACARRTRRCRRARAGSIRTWSMWRRSTTWPRAATSGACAVPSRRARCTTFSRRPGCG